jgi:hypothetical protein
MGMTCKMQNLEYTGELWHEGDLHPALVNLITSRDLLIEIVSGDSPLQVTVGVPHQAAVGVTDIADEWWDPKRQKQGRESDEAAALFALAAFASLRDQGMPCELVIAAHATDHDPNKALDSPYCQRIFARSSRLLFECHGASKNRPNDLEVTAGSNPLAHPALFGRLLAQALAWRYNVAAQTRPGIHAATVFVDERKEEQGKLTLPALNTDSLRQAATKQMHALHLEAKPVFRICEDKPNTLTEDGKVLGQAIATAIIGYLDSI